jgi:RNA polymerase sigma factor (sigma-70 family)
MNERRRDFELLQAFARRGEQTAFADLVRRHLDLVFGTALRRLEDTQGAQEVAQNVFAALARKAWQFSPDDSLPAWLHKTALLESKSWLRGELRRRRREETAAELGTTMKTPDEQPAFNALVPLLDEALLSLREKDRAALLLRFYESQSLRQVGMSLGVGEDAAQKRVQNALDKLVQFFQRRGFKTATVAASTAALQHTATSAPAAAANLVISTALQAAQPAAAGVTAVLARFASLNKVQTAAACMAAAAVPLGWQWHEQRAAAVQAEREQAQWVTVQSESATTGNEIHRLRAEVEKLQNALAQAEERAAEDASELSEFEAWRKKIRARLMEADYRWAEDSPFVRIPKSALRQVEEMKPIVPPGRIMPEARELLGLTPQEREEIEAVLHKHFATLDGLIENTVYETNKARLSSKTASHSYSLDLPPSVAASKVWIVPPLGDDAKESGDELLAGLQRTLGEERWALVKPLLDSNGVNTQRHILNLDAAKEGQEVVAWIKEQDGRTLVGVGCAGPNGSYSSSGMALNLFLPDATTQDESSTLERLELNAFPESLTRRVKEWIQQQAAARSGEEARR